MVTVTVTVQTHGAWTVTLSDSSESAGRRGPAADHTLRLTSR